jgi:hypothetical protein
MFRLPVGIAGPKGASLGLHGTRDALAVERDTMPLDPCRATRALEHGGLSVLGELSDYFASALGL